MKNKSTNIKIYLEPNNILKNIFLILVIIINCSCTDNNNNGSEQISGEVRGTAIPLELKNSTGANLLSTEKYSPEKIVAKYLIEGKIVQNTNSSDAVLDNPNNVWFEKQNGEVKNITIFLNHSEKEEFPITYIYWNDTEIDTIKAQYKRYGNSFAYEKLWLFENNSWKELFSGPIIIVK